MSATEIIEIVDNNDKVIGTEERKIAHSTGLAHRIISVVIKDAEGAILLQQRSATKSENPLKWDLSATGHVDPGEDYLTAASRETAEEIGISDINLTFVGKYFYEEHIHEKRILHFNAVFTGASTQTPKADQDEVAQTAWFTQTEFLKKLSERPDDFTLRCHDIVERFGAEIVVKK